MILIAAATLAGSPILQLHAQYETCVKAQTVRLGSSNSEPAETIIRAVRSVCQPQWIAMVMEYGDQGVLAHWRENAENDAIAALLEARGNDHSVPCGAMQSQCK